MADETPPPAPSGPFALTTKGDSSWVTPIPWAFEAPLAAIVAYLIVSGPLDATHLVPAMGVLLAMAVIALPGIVQFTPEVRAWARRTATVGEDDVTVEMGDRGPQRFEWSRVERITTRPITHGTQFPQVLHLVTDFYDHEGTRVPELTVHHSTYRSMVRKAEVNNEGAAFLAALEGTPAAEAFDLSTRTFLDLVVRQPVALMEGISDETIGELEAGRLWHARRSAMEDKREVDRVPDALMLLSYVLRKDSQRTAREARLERPDDPIVRYYLAHAILQDARAAAMLRDPAAVKRRKRHRAEGVEMLSELRSDPVWGERAARDLHLIEIRQLAREEESTPEKVPPPLDPLAARADAVAHALEAAAERGGPYAPKPAKKAQRWRRRPGR